jgi:hypothetical protein
MLINAWTALFFTAKNIQTLLAAEILCGIVRLGSLSSSKSFAGNVALGETFLC